MENRFASQDQEKPSLEHVFLDVIDKVTSEGGYSEQGRGSASPTSPLSGKSSQKYQQWADLSSALEQVVQRVAALEHAAITQTSAHLELRVAALEEAYKSELDMPKSRGATLETLKTLPSDEDHEIGKTGYDKKGTSDAVTTTKTKLGRWSTRADSSGFNQKDEETPYTFQPSVWDLALFIGSPLFSIGETVVIVLIFIVNLVVLATFVVMCQFTLVRHVFDHKTLHDFRLWRSAVAHDINYMNTLTGESLASGVCNEKLYVPVSNYHLEVVQDLRDYLEFPEIERDIPKEVVMSYLSLMLFYFVLIPEFRSITHIWAAWTRLPVKKEGTVFEIDQEDHSIHISSIAFGRQAFMVTILVLRLLVLVVLGWQGTQWLGKEIDMGNMILNSVALQLVLDIDEFVYASLVPATPQSVMERIIPLKCDKKSTFDKWWDSQGVFWFLCCTFIPFFVVIGHTLFKPYADELRDNLNALCGGLDASSYDFVLAVDAIGIPWTAPTNALPDDWVPDDYARAAISQAQRNGYASPLANLQPTQRNNSGFYMQVFDGETLASLKSELPEFRRPSDWEMMRQGNFMQVFGWSEEHKVMKGQDFGDQKDTVYNHYLRYLLGTSGNVTCAAVPLDRCLTQGGRLQDVVMRQLCPRHCGCTSPTNGTVANPYVQFGTEVWLGCAPWTVATKEFQEKLAELPCNDTKSRGTFSAWAKGVGNASFVGNASLSSGVKLFDHLMSEFDIAGCPGVANISIGQGDTARICAVTSVSAICPISCGCLNSTPWSPRHSITSSLCPHECQRPNRQCITIAVDHKQDTGTRGPHVGYPCTFPFRYKGKRYDRCTTIDWVNAWCAVTTARGLSFLWGDCPEDCDHDSDYIANAKGRPE